MIAKDVPQPDGAMATVRTCIGGEGAAKQGSIWSRAAPDPADRTWPIRGPVDGLNTRMFKNKFLSGFDFAREMGPRNRDRGKLDRLYPEAFAVTMSPSGARGDVDLKHGCLRDYDAW